MRADDLGPAMRLLADHGLRGMTSQPPTLEELFLREYGDSRHLDPTTSAVSQR